MPYPAGTTSHGRGTAALPHGLIPSLRYAWLLRRDPPATAPPAAPAEAAASFLQAAQRAGGGLLAAGFDLRRGWLPADPAITARTLRAMLKAATPLPGTSGMVGNGITMLLAAAPRLQHPEPLAALAHLLLDLDAQDRAGGRWEASLLACGQQLAHSQDIAGTWTIKAGGAVECTAAVQAGWALQRLAGRRGGEAAWERGAQQSLEWALGKQKSNGYFYACTWSHDPATNPLLIELCDTIEGLLQMGLARDQKSWRMAALLTLKHLTQRTPAGQLAWGAWTSEWNHERHRSPLGTMRLADLLRQAQAAPGPERHAMPAEDYADTLDSAARRCQLAGIAGCPEVAGAVPATLPAWGRPLPGAVSTEAAAWAGSLPVTRTG